jgi:hypothetical protein
VNVRLTVEAGLRHSEKAMHLVAQARRVRSVAAGGNRALLLAIGKGLHSRLCILVGLPRRGSVHRPVGFASRRLAQIATTSLGNDEVSSSLECDM